MSTDPWPGKASTDDYQLGGNWYSYPIEAALFIKDQQGPRLFPNLEKSFYWIGQKDGSGWEIV